MNCYLREKNSSKNQTFEHIIIILLDNYIPKKTKESSLLFDSPGLAYRPRGGLGYTDITGKLHVS